MLCLFPSLFFPSHTPLFYFVLFALITSLLHAHIFCHHFIKMKNEMIFLMHLLFWFLCLTSFFTACSCILWNGVGWSLLSFPTHSVSRSQLRSFLLYICILLSLLCPLPLSLCVCAFFSYPPPSVNLHVPSLILFIILTLLHPPFP